MNPQMVLMRLDKRSGGTFSPCERSNSRCCSPAVGIDALLNHTGLARWDVNNPFHVAVLEPKGILQTYVLETIDGGSKAYLYPQSAFQLHLSYDSASSLRSRNSGVWNEHARNKDHNPDGIVGLCLGTDGGTDDRNDGGTDLAPHPIEKAWGSFDFLPNHPDDIVFFHVDSNQILFAHLPRGPSRQLYTSDGKAKPIPNADKIYCVGRHSSSIFAIAVRSDGLVLASAAKDGFIRVWKLFDGSMLAQFKFSGWGQSRCPQNAHIAGVSLSRDTETLSKEKKILHFLETSGDLIIGCPSGEIRFWSVDMQKDSGASLSMKHTGSITSGRDEISSLALHAPTTIFPARAFSKNADQRHDPSSEGGGKNTMSLSSQELIAVGNNKGNLQIWTVHSLLHEWVLIWSRSCLDDLPTGAGKNEAHILCLSFRADGKLLAAAVSNSVNHNRRRDPSSRKDKWCNDFLILYDTTTWTILQTLNFSCQLGSCFFYHPDFEVQNQLHNHASKTREKISSCRLLLISTSAGPQIHILPEYGIFDEDNKEAQEMNVNSACMQKTNRGQPEREQNKMKRQAENVEEPLGVDGEGDGSGSCETRPQNTNDPVSRRNMIVSKLDCCSFSENNDETVVYVDDWTPSVTDGHGVNEPSPYPIGQNIKSKSTKPLSFPEPFESESEGAIKKGHFRKSNWDRGLHSLRKFKFKRNDDIQRHGSKGPKHSPLVNKVSNSGVHDCDGMGLRGSYNQADRRRRKKTGTYYVDCALVHSNQERADNSSLNNKDDGTKANFGSGNANPDGLSNKRNEATTNLYYSNCAKREKSSMNCDAIEGNAKNQNPKIDDSILERKEDNFLNRSHILSQNLPKLHAVDPTKRQSVDEAPTSNCDDVPDAFGDGISNPKVKLLHPENREGKENVRKTTTKGEKNTKHSTSKKKITKVNFPRWGPRDSKNNHNLGNAEPTPKEVATVAIGGEDLEELLLMSEVNLPLIRTISVGNTFKDKPGSAFRHFNQRDNHRSHSSRAAPATGVQEEEEAMVASDELGAMKQGIKSSYMLNYPKAFSTASLMQRVHEIEQERFDVETAIKVAKKKGIPLNEEDVEGLKAALEEEAEGDGLGDGQNASKGKEKSDTPSSRKRYHFPLTKISDPRLTHQAPPLASPPSRKAKRHVEASSRRRAGGGGGGEDLRTIQPDLLDLWDPQERCPQVRSSENVDWRISRSCEDTRGPAEYLEWAQREENCRAIRNAQAVYQNCLYGSLFEPTCNCTRSGV